MVQEFGWPRAQELGGATEPRDVLTACDIVGPEPRPAEPASGPVSTAKAADEAQQNAHLSKFYELHLCPLHSNYPYRE